MSSFQTENITEILGYKTHPEVRKIFKFIWIKIEFAYNLASRKRARKLTLENLQKSRTFLLTSEHPAMSFDEWLISTAYANHVGSVFMCGY